MKVKDFWNNDMRPKDSRLQDAIRHKYMDNDIHQYAIITAGDEIAWWAFIFKGDRTWFAIKNGFRLSTSTVSKAINAITVDKSTVSSQDLQKVVMLDAL